jgi:DNA-binding LytR/AlgR family response regulator
MIKIAICDDDSKSLEMLSTQLNKFAKDANTEIVIIKYSNGNKLLYDWNNQTKYADILYLEINMLAVSGMEIAQSLRKQGFINEIIFYTKSNKRILNAFDVNAFHYIIKDATSTHKAEEIFRRAVKRVEIKREDYISFSCAGENRNVAISQIQYFTVSGKVITVYYGDNRTFEFYTTLGKIEEALYLKGFVRVNKNALVNMYQVDQRTAKNVVMKNGTSFTIGRNYRAEVKDEAARLVGGVGDLMLKKRIIVLLCMVMVLAQPVIVASAKNDLAVAEPVDTDGDGIPDYLDKDSDNDTLPDSDEATGNKRVPNEGSHATTQDDKADKRLDNSNEENGKNKDNQDNGKKSAWQNMKNSLTKLWNYIYTHPYVAGFSASTLAFLILVVGIIVDVRVLIWHKNKRRKARARYTKRD